jgi:acyl-CoA thioesterase-1
MRNVALYPILAVLAATLAGCKADTASRASSEMSQSNSDAPKVLKAAPSAADDTPLVAHKPAGGPDARPLLVCFGDSLTAGYGADDGQSYPDFLQKDLDRDGYQYRVVNEGISGNTTKDGVDRMAGVIALKPEVVVLEFGGNDGLRGLKVQTTRTNLASMVAGLQKAGIKVLIAGISLPPDYGPDYVNAFKANYGSVARQYNVPVLPFLYKDVYGVDGMIQPDGIHATDRGNEAVAKNVVPMVEPLLKR